MTITPEKLRSLADAQMGAAVVPDEARMLADAMEIADEAAMDALTCNLSSPDWKQDHPWLDMNSRHEADRDWMQQSAKYLDARGLLEHHPEHSEWVRLKAVAP